MIRLWLFILRVICVIQLVIAVSKSFTSLISLFADWEFIYLFQSVGFAVIAALPVQVFIILSTNYPDRIIEGRQKKKFNRLFLINFLLIAFLFGFIFYDYRQMKTGLGIIDPFPFINFFISVTMLAFQLVILYGLIWLRSTIYDNVMQKQFDFEMQDEND
jgi:hypothetical protein